MSRIRKAVLPVAGLGSRFLPVTKAVPKELLPILDTPILSYAIEEAKQAGIEEFIFVSARGKDAIADYVDAQTELTRQLRENGKVEQAELVQATALLPGNATFIRQDRPLGLGHAVWCARNAVGNEPFVVILPDDVILAKEPCTRRMVEAHNRYGGNLAAVVEVPKEHVSRYGILNVERDDGQCAMASGLVEKPDPDTAPSNLAIIGRYVLGPGIFDTLSTLGAGSGGEIQLTDAIAERIERESFHGVRFEGQRFDCGSREGYLEATISFALARDDLSDTMARILSSYTSRAA